MAEYGQVTVKMSQGKRTRYPFVGSLERLCGAQIAKWENKFTTQENLTNP
jgi:hypothetical protein